MPSRVKVFDSLSNIIKVLEKTVLACELIPAFKSFFLEVCVEAFYWLLFIKSKLIMTVW